MAEGFIPVGWAGQLTEWPCCSYSVRMAYWTVQQLIDEGMTLHAYCHNPRCHHNKRIDLNVLLDKLGPDAPAMADDLAPKMRCEKCKGKAVGLIYAPDKTTGDVNPFARNSNGRRG